MTRFVPRAADAPVRPLIGVLCCNEVADRPIQAVASRFVEPLANLAGATVLLVPALPDATDAGEIAARLDGLLLTGARSNVAGHRYGGPPCRSGPADERRDEVALALSARMIERGRPVFGICRGLQELNVLFGGTLTCDLPSHRRDGPEAYEALFDHEHEVSLRPDGVLADAFGATQLTVNSCMNKGSHGSAATWSRKRSRPTTA